MSDYTVVADVGDSIVSVLWEEIQADPQVAPLFPGQAAISLESPAELQTNNAVRLSIYLYRVVEDATMKNQFPVPGNGGRLRKPPLTLDLFYLITPMVGAPREQHIVLGKVMQVLYERSILEGADLQGSLSVGTEPVRVILNPVTFEETTRVWQALETSYRLSVCYVVRVALVDSLRETSTQRVLDSTARYGERG